MVRGWLGVEAARPRLEIECCLLLGEDSGIRNGSWAFGSGLNWGWGFNDSKAYLVW